MKPMIAFPANRPELKLSSHTSAPLPQEERRRINEDNEALRQREANLREYEAHLRSWQERIEKGQTGSAPGFTGTNPTRPPTGTPFEQDEALQMAWDKLIRARELLEAEQAHLRDDRLNLKEATAVLKRREEAVAAREARLAQREEQVTAVIDAKITEQAQPSALARFTQAPFMMAKSVFTGKKQE